MGISITGMISGLDTAQMVSDLMDVERIPYTNLKTKKTNLQSEQTIFRTINTKFSALETAANQLKYSSDYNVLKATSSNASVLTATTSTGALTGSYKLNVTKLAKEATATATGINANDNSWAQAILSGSIDLKVNGVALDLTAATAGANLDENSSNKDVLTALTTYINKNSSTLNYKATLVKTSESIDPVTQEKIAQYAISLQTNDTGSNQTIEMSGLPTGTKTNIESGQNAEFTFNGITVSRSTNTIDDVIQGVSLTLTGANETTLDIKQDVDSITTKVESFVNAYNELIQLVNDNLAKPTDENTINPLQGDSTLKNISSQLYSMFTDVFSTNSTYKFMSQIGLSIDEGVKKSSDITGLIKFDKEKFSSALETNSSEVFELISNSEKDNQGIIHKIANTIRSSYTSTVNGILTSKITGYDSEIKVVDERLEAMDRSLQMKETRLKQQFATMETLLATLKSEQDWLTSQFEALTKSS